MYKFRLATSVSLSKSIQENAATILKSRNEIKRITERNKLNLKKLKKANADLSKLSVQKVKLKEKSTKLKNTYKKQESAVKELSAIIRQDTIEILDQINSIIKDLKNILLDSDTILYRESKALDKFHREIDLLADKKQSAQIANKLNLLKEEMKTTSRRLYQAIEAPIILRKPFAKPLKEPISKHIFLLGKDIEGIERIFDKLNISRIDEIIKKAERQLSDLRKVELAVTILVPTLKQHLAVIKDDIYLLESSAASRIEEKLSNTEKYLEKSLAKATNSAEKLLQDIIIVKEIK
ncbi:MAG: hypothetical protein V3V78_03155 [Candidatus Woesearchaeota archaeon]